MQGLNRTSRHGVNTILVRKALLPYKTHFIKRSKVNMKILKTFTGELRRFLVLWSTQSLSALGSSMTNFALIVWSYQQQGSALTTALLSVCSYAP